MTAPFDPEAEARRLFDAADWAGPAESQVADALRRAYEAGAADMRERAAREVYLVDVLPGDIMVDVMNRIAARVRALSPSEPR